MTSPQFTQDELKTILHVLEKYYVNEPPPRYETILGKVRGMITPPNEHKLDEIRFSFKAIFFGNKPIFNSCHAVDEIDALVKARSMYPSAYDIIFNK